MPRDAAGTSHVLAKEAGGGVWSSSNPMWELGVGPQQHAHGRAGQGEEDVAQQVQDPLVHARVLTAHCQTKLPPYQAVSV